MCSAVTNYTRVQDFHKIVGVKPSDFPHVDDLDLAFTLIDEELDELAEAAAGEYDDRINKYEIPAQRRQHIAKEIADLLYVVYGLAHRYNIDIDAAFAAVHESNLTKFCYTPAEVTQTVQRCKDVDVDVKYTNMRGIIRGNKDVYVIKRARDGKVMKGVGYKEPDLSGV